MKDLYTFFCFAFAGLAVVLRARAAPVRAVRRMPIIILFALLMPSLAQAAVIKMDLNSPGDNLLTYDTSTGFEWLNFSQSIGPLFSTVAELQPGGALYGFTLAYQSQVQTLVSDFVSSTGLPAHNLMNDLGSTSCYYAGACLPYAAFYTQESLNNISWQGPGGSLPLILFGASELITPSDVVPHETFWASRCTGCAADLANANYETALALYRMATPLPASLPLFASGLGAIGLIARRRKRKHGGLTISLHDGGTGIR